MEWGSNPEIKLLRDRKSLSLVDTLGNLKICPKLSEYKWMDNVW